MKKKKVNNTECVFLPFSFNFNLAATKKSLGVKDPLDCSLPLLAKGLLIVYNSDVQTLHLNNLLCQLCTYFKCSSWQSWLK